jgi:hypothetical protein
MVVSYDDFFFVIASVAKQSSFAKKEAGLLRRCAPRNDGEC